MNQSNDENESSKKRKVVPFVCGDSRLFPTTKQKKIERMSEHDDDERVVAVGEGADDRQTISALFLTHPILCFSIRRTRIGATVEFLRYS